MMFHGLVDYDASSDEEQAQTSGSDKFKDGKAMREDFSGEEQYDSDLEKMDEDFFDDDAEIGSSLPAKNTGICYCYSKGHIYLSCWSFFLSIYGARVTPQVCAGYRIEVHTIIPYPKFYLGYTRRRVHPNVKSKI